MAKILLVDDDETIRVAVKRYLEFILGDDTEVVTSWCGHQAEGHLRRDTFDLIITDLQMPHGDGTVVLAYCKREEIETPIIVNTAETERDKELIGLGAVRVVHKDTKALAEAVKAILENPPTP